IGKRKLRGARPRARGLVRIRHRDRCRPPVRALPARRTVERHPVRGREAARWPQRVRPRIGDPRARCDQTHRDLRADSTGADRTATDVRLREAHGVARGRGKAAVLWCPSDTGSGSPARLADQGLFRSAFEEGSTGLHPVLPRTRGPSARRDRRRVPIPRGEGGHCQVSSGRTDPASGRNRLAPLPSGHAATCEDSRAPTETTARLAVPTPIAAALSVTGSVAWPHRLMATVAKAAQVAERTIASIGNALSNPAVPICPRKIRRIPPKPRPIPASFWTVNRSPGRTAFATRAVCSGSVANKIAESPLSTPLFSPQ